MEWTYLDIIFVIEMRIENTDLQLSFLTWIDLLVNPAKQGQGEYHTHADFTDNFSSKSNVFGNYVKCGYKLKYYGVLWREPRYSWIIYTSE